MKKILMILTLVLSAIYSSAQTYMASSPKDTHLFKSEKCDSLISQIEPFKYFMAVETNNSNIWKVKYNNNEGYIKVVSFVVKINVTSELHDSFTYSNDYGYYVPNYLSRANTITNEYKDKYTPAKSETKTTYSSPSSSGGTVQVKGYYRKDGTYVRPHTRSTPRRR